MAASLGINLLALALPLAILQVYDRVLRHHSLSTLTVLTIGALAAFAIEFSLRVLRQRILAAEGARYDHWHSTAMVQRFLAADTESFKKETPGTYANCFHAIRNVRAFYCQAAVLIADAPFMLIFIALIAAVAGWVALVPVALLGMLLAVGIVGARRLVVETARREQSDVKRHNFFVECLSGIITVKALGLEPIMERRNERLQEDAAAAFGAISRTTAQMQAVVTELAQAASVLTVAAGAMVVVAGDLTIGGLAATTILTGRLLQPVLKGVGLLARYPFVQVAEQRLMLVEKLPRQTARKHEFPAAATGTLTFENTSYAYDGAAARAVEGVSLTLPPGAYIGITGQSSSGRSTLLKLANGMLTPVEGSVRYNDAPLSVYSPSQMRRRIALLASPPTLYSGTLLENLTSFEDGPVKRRALALCRALGLENFVATLSRGLDTPVNAGDIPLGMVQMIAIVRALAHDPRVVLFDMANAALDHECDRRLIEFFKHHKGRLSAIFVTDRPSYLKMCDAVYEMTDGRLRPLGAGEVLRAGEVA